MSGNDAASIDAENSFEVTRAKGEAQFAGFWLRTLAIFADSSMLFFATLILFIPFTFAGDMGVTLASVLAVLIQLLYWPIMHASERQATFGKAMVGIKVTDAEGDRVSMLRSFGRELAKIISWLPMGIGFLIAAFSGKKQALHDMIASTLVVRDGDAHIARTLVVAVLGYALPMIAIPLFGMALFAGVLASVMGDMMGEMKKPPSPPASISKPAAPKPAAPVKPPEAPKPEAGAVSGAPSSGAATPAQPPAVVSPAPVVADKPVAAAPVFAPAVSPESTPQARTEAPKAPPQPDKLGNAPAESALCVIRPVMTDAQINACRTPETPQVRRASDEAAAPGASTPISANQQRPALAPMPCEIKPVMTNAEIEACRRR